MEIAKEGLQGLLFHMLAPKKGERMLFLTDYPEGALDGKRQKRLELLMRFYNAALELSEKIGFRLLPIAKYRETMMHNGELPYKAATHDGGHISNLPELVGNVNIAIAMTEYSATAPLKNIASRAPSLRVVSMPGVTADMEGAMSADYAAIANRAARLNSVLSGCAGIEVTFDGAGVPRGTRLFIDTRGTSWISDDGICREPGSFINFPSGEVFAPPYEAATPEGKSVLGGSRTEGTLPIYSHKDKRVAFLKVERNRIVRVQGDCDEAVRIVEDIAKDENCANIAEIGFGINGKARCGPGVMVLEAEKAGVHIAYGRSDHFGRMGSHAGKVKAMLHRDIVYARESEIKATCFAVFENGRRLLIAERGKVVAV